ncbi:MAG: hypothetical protein WAM75_11040 [Xanthobacteraceae bacterium]
MDSYQFAVTLPPTSFASPSAAIAAPWFGSAVYNTTLGDMLGAPYQDHYRSYPLRSLLFIWPLKAHI